MNSIRPKIGIDVDDVLYACNEYACALATKDYNLVPPLTVDEITQWGKRNDRSDLVFKYFAKEEFFRNQPLLPGAGKFIETLMQLGDVYLITAVDPKYMGIRINRLLEDFPGIPKENIIMGYQKSLIKVDILLDDSPRNIIESSAMYPVVFRRPWNLGLTENLSVDTYEEFLDLVKHIQDTKKPRYKKLPILFGPSGSGKTAIIKASGLPVLETVTTRPPREGDIGYTYVSEEEFQSMEFMEKSSYAGHFYGTRHESVEKLPGRAAKAMDIIGALKVRMVYPYSVLVYVNRPKEEIVKSILERDVPMEDKVRRICSLEYETSNIRFADYVCESCKFTYSAWKKVSGKNKHTRTGTCKTCKRKITETKACTFKNGVCTTCKGKKK